tara:strand:- start:1716 stop:3182 length:1467 start_codon:yes stop_codon:yes gene_type:complete
MFNSSLNKLSTLLATGKVSSVELTKDFLQHINFLNKKYNAFITVNEEISLDQARIADAMISSGRGGSLTGIPIAHKDIFCTKGWLTTCGSKMLANFVSPYDAHVIERFNKVGTVNIGKTNMDEFAMGSSNETSFYGPVKNPWDVKSVPGGSSGGSACAVAARMAPAATGTDTGGSIRQPASLCGVSGIKPTYGLVSRYGMIAFASSLDQGGAIAKSASDLALMLNVMVDFDIRDSTSLQHDTEDYTRDLEKSLSGIRIGLPKEYFIEGIDDDVAQAVDSAVKEYSRLGAKIIEVSLPNTKLSIPVYYVLAPAEASSNLSRFDGVRYGHRSEEYINLDDMYQKSRAQGFGEEVKRRILIGTYVLSHGYYDAYYIKAQKLRRLIAQDFSKVFKHCDIIMGPTSPSVAFSLGEKNNDPLQMYLSDTYTAGASLSGLPGMSIPVGFGKGNRPVGLHIIGNYFSEARILNVAHKYQQVTDWHTRMPDINNSKN